MDDRLFSQSISVFLRIKGKKVFSLFIVVRKNDKSPDNPYRDLSEIPVFFTFILTIFCFD